MLLLQRRRAERDTMFFSRSAEKKRIDYVLVYGRDGAEDKRREEFEEGLKTSGLELEHEDIAVSITIAFYYYRLLRHKGSSTRKTYKIKDTFNHLKGRAVNWLHFAIEV